jgi:hypothetical protein
MSQLFRHRTGRPEYAYNGLGTGAWTFWVESMFHQISWHGMCSVTRHLASPRPPATPRISPGVGGWAAGDTLLRRKPPFAERPDEPHGVSMHWENLMYERNRCCGVEGSAPAMFSSDLVSVGRKATPNPERLVDWVYRTVTVGQGLFGTLARIAQLLCFSWSAAAASSSKLIALAWLASRSVYRRVRTSEFTPSIRTHSLPKTFPYMRWL